MSLLEALADFSSYKEIRKQRSLIPRMTSSTHYATANMLVLVGIPTINSAKEIEGWLARLAPKSGACADTRLLEMHVYKRQVS
jgi:hypothetical protein